MKIRLISAALLLVAAQAQAANLGSSSADGISATVGVVSLSVLSSLESTNYYTLQAQDDAAACVA
ncbi:MAG: hypothetical protein RSE08_07795, partial [Lactococcus sp.]